MSGRWANGRALNRSLTKRRSDARALCGPSSGFAIVSNIGVVLLDCSKEMIVTAPASEPQDFGELSRVVAPTEQMVGFNRR